MKKGLHKKDYFLSRLDEASQIVSNWPEWKQKTLGPSTSELKEKNNKNK